MLKLTTADKEYLLNCGYSEDDFRQVEEAFQKSKTKYRLDSKRITREKAISLLGWEKYLSGISRSAFHFTAARETENGQIVYFDSRNLFK